MARYYSPCKSTITFISICFIAVSCTTSGPAGLFGKKSAHEQYADKLKVAGLEETALGKSWLAAAEQGLLSPLSVNLPYSETGYFPADQAKAAGLLFQAKRGERLNINLTKKPGTNFTIYLDLWEPASTAAERPKLLLSADSTAATVVYNVDKDGSYILRLQPELLRGGEYTLTINAGPSLAFPLDAKVKSNIGSFWGAGRDRGVRKHEGIDIFAPRGTPLIAAADGVIGGVTENTLGGKVIFLRPDNESYTLYYAHLDRQLVAAGQLVKTGDTIGLVGNTGNARTTAPHLHFGIYTNSGAIDPLPFVYPINKKPEKITAALSNLNNLVRTNKPIKMYISPSKTSGTISVEENTLLKPEAATASWYRVSLPDGQKGFVASTNVSSISTPVRTISLKKEQPLLDTPDNLASRKTTLMPGQSISILAAYKGFYYIKNTNSQEGWLLKNAL